MVATVTFQFANYLVFFVSFVVNEFALCDLCASA
jgi:hypothetical protein